MKATKLLHSVINVNAKRLRHIIAMHDAFIAKHPHGLHSHDYIINNIHIIIKSMLKTMEKQEKIVKSEST